MQQSPVPSHIEAIERDGYTIIENVLKPDLVDAIGKRVRELEKQTLGQTEQGRPVDGSCQLRTAGLLQLDPLFWEIPILGDVLPVIQGILGSECQLTAFSAIDVLPGENKQPIHPDDALIPLPRPHQPIVCTCMVAIDDFTIENGATRLLPGSHKTAGALDQGTDYRKVDGMIAAEMRAGSVVAFNGAVLHLDADNESDAPRLGLEVSYCAPWMRAFTNFLLSIPQEEVMQYPQPLKDLIGYRDFDGIIANRFGDRLYGSYRESYGQLRKDRAARAESEKLLREKH
jgi:ectoine hydroxylase-related dioxygenase (phytanoyl-CoA dioxygenase family)